MKNNARIGNVAVAGTATTPGAPTPRTVLDKLQLTYSTLSNVLGLIGAIEDRLGDGGASDSPDVVGSTLHGVAADTERLANAIHTRLNNILGSL